MIRIVLMLTGTCCLGLGILGVFLPLLPTTPFVLVAAGCYARSSARAHRWLMQSPVLGDAIHQWQEQRAIPRRARHLAVTMIVSSLGISIIWIVPTLYGQLVLLTVGTCVITFLYRLPVIDQQNDQGATS